MIWGAFEINIQSGSIGSPCYHMIHEGLVSDARSDGNICRWKPTADGHKRSERGKDHDENRGSDPKKG